MPRVVIMMTAYGSVDAAVEAGYRRVTRRLANSIPRFDPLFLLENRSRVYR